MSYDLYFWRQERSFESKPEQVIDLLAAETPVEGVVAFPRAGVRAVLRNYFPSTVDNDVSLEWEGAGSYFQIQFSHATEKTVHLVIVNCGFELLKSEETMNRLIEACNSFGCALYDPQTGQRYEQPEPKIDLGSA